MERRTRNRLLCEATADPSQLLRRKKFWKLEFWPHYLRRCDDVLFNDPRAGLAFSKPAPQLAAQIAKTNPGASDPDLLLLGYSYLASAYRRNDEYGCAEEAFRLCTASSVGPYSTAPTNSSTPPTPTSRPRSACLVTGGVALTPSSSSAG